MTQQTQRKLPQIIGIALIFDMILLDQLSKWWVITHLYIGEGHDANLLTWLFSTAPRFNMPIDPVTSYFNMVMVWNKGISFGLFNQANSVSVMILSTISFLIAGGFFMWLISVKRIFPALGIGMIVGGAISNVWDRLRFGAVADFFDFHVMGYHWPAFNVADAAIVLGVVILMIDTLFFDKDTDEDLY